MDLIYRTAYTYLVITDDSCICIRGYPYNLSRLGFPNVLREILSYEEILIHNIYLLLKKSIRCVSSSNKIIKCISSRARCIRLKHRIRINLWNKILNFEIEDYGLFSIRYLVERSRILNQFRIYCGKCGLLLLLKKTSNKLR